MLRSAAVFAVVLGVLVCQPVIAQQGHGGKRIGSAAERCEARASGWERSPPGTPATGRSRRAAAC
jgi:hypothetical protein